MKRIIVDCFDKQKRIALVEDGELLEFVFEDGKNQSIVGNIYCGIVENVVEGMQCAFVNIGMNRNAYMYYGDERAENNKLNIKKNRPKVGDSIIVKVERDAIGDKGAFVTSKISYNGKFLVIIPNENNIGISKRIFSKKERERIKNIIKKILPDGYGIIVRTAGEGKTLFDFENEINEIMKKIDFVNSKGRYIKPPYLILEDFNISFNIIRDIYSSDVDEILVNDLDYYNKLLGNIDSYCISDKINYYNSNIPIFEEYFIESKIKKLLSKKVWLKSGGFIIIEETEACVIIDVNTGKFTGNKNFEKTIMKTNIEAAIEIAKQLKLRNLSGIIIIDFIDIKNEENKLLLRRILDQELSKDRIKTCVVGMTELGLMQITRKKIKNSLSKFVFSQCKECSGLGSKYSFEWIINVMQRELINKLLNTNFLSINIKCNYDFISKINYNYPNFLDYIKYKTNKDVYFVEDNNKRHYDYEFC